jgi:hypothetical protein
MFKDKSFNEDDSVGDCIVSDCSTVNDTVTAVEVTATQSGSCIEQLQTTSRYTFLKSGFVE